MRQLAIAAVVLIACKRQDPPPPPVAPPAEVRTTEVASAAPDAAVPAARLSPEEIEADARDSARTAVRTGFLSRDEVEERTREELAEELDADEQVLAAKAKAIVAPLWRAQLEEEKTWRGLTDCDRLDLAFAALEKQGVLARQNYEDCQTCAVGAIAEEMATARNAGKKVVGYTYFHEQDTESAAEGGGLRLAFGAAPHGPLTEAKVAALVVAALEAQGLAPRWDGDASRRIGVPLQWRKRHLGASRPRAAH